MLHKCSSCQEQKSFSEFSKNVSKPQGLSTECKACCVRRYNAKRTTSICSSCVKPKLQYSAYCLYHYVYSTVGSQVSKKNLKLSLDEKKHLINCLLEKLSNQKFRCYYTGISLIAGLNMSLEHIEPYSKNKNNDISNLVWADLAFNTIKGSGSIELAKEKFSIYTQAIKTNEYPTNEGL